MSNYFQKLTDELRLPDAEVLPDGRKRLTRYPRVIHSDNVDGKLATAYGTLHPGNTTAPSGWAGLRLINAKLTDDLNAPGKDTRPSFVVIYEQIPATAEIQVGGNTQIQLEDGRTAIEAEFLQFTAGTYAPGTVGNTTAPGDSSAYLKTVEAPDDGTLRRIKRTYVHGGIITTDDQSEQGGALLKKTIVSVKDVPSTPSGFTLVGSPVQSPNGLPVYTYTYAKGTGIVSTGINPDANGKLVIYDQVEFNPSGSYTPTTPSATIGGTVTLVDQKKDAQNGFYSYTSRWAEGFGEVDRATEYLGSPDLGTTGVSQITIKHLTAPGASDPTTAPSGFGKISISPAAQDGYIMWTVICKKGQGTIDSSKQVSNGGKLVTYSITALGTAPTAPAATIGGTVTQIANGQRNGSRAEDGTIIYDYRWAEGQGEASRRFTNSQGGSTDFDPSAPTSSTGPVRCVIEFLTATSITTDPTTPPASFKRLNVDHEDRDGYRVWTVAFGYGTGIVENTTQLSNRGKLVTYRQTELNPSGSYTPTTPSATISGTVNLVSQTKEPSEGCFIYHSTWAEGLGVVDKRINPRQDGMREETWVSLGTSYDSSFMLPPGILLLKDSDDLDGVTRWTVTCMQNAAGGSPVAGTVNFVGITNGGSGYTVAPTVSFTGGGGSGAAGYAVLTGGAVTAIAITGGGSGYTSNPTVTFSGGGGSGAAATVLLNLTTVQTVTVVDGGSGYTLGTPPNVNFVGGGEFVTPATATATLVAKVLAVVMGTGGAGYLSVPSVAFTGAGGSGAAGTAIVAGTVSGITITSQGSGYNGTQTVTLTGGGGSGATATVNYLGGSGNIVSIIVTNGGSGYTSAPTVVISGGGGSGAAATASVWAGHITSSNVTNGGSGYATAPTVAITGGGGSGATAVASINGSGVVTQVSITACGSGYTSTPSIGFSGGGGSGAAATAVLSGTSSVIGVTVTNQGSGYTATPTAVFSGGGGSGAAAGVAMTTASVGSITITSAGGGYSSVPTVVVDTSLSGTTATGTAVLQATIVVSATVMAGGSGYTSAPTVGFTGGGGSGATATATVSTISVGAVIVTNGGNNYATAPTVVFSTGAAAGTAVLGGAGVTTKAYLPFTYPGRAKPYGSVAFGPAGASGFIDVFLSPPTTALVLATVSVSIQSWNYVGDVDGKLPFPLWNPKDYATVTASFVDTSGFARSITRGLEGYGASPSSPVYNTFFNGSTNGAGACMGQSTGENSGAIITIFGGPQSPDGNTTYTLHAEVEKEPVFTAYDGTQYFRQIIIIATPERQAPLPV